MGCCLLDEETNFTILSLHSLHKLIIVAALLKEMLRMKKKIDAHIIATMGLLIGLMVVLSQVLGFETQLLKITFDFCSRSGYG